MNAWNLPDPIPVHREPINTPRIALVSKYPTLPDAKQFRLPNIGFSVQKAAVDKGIAKEYPIILSSGRLVEYEGGGEETRSNKWLAELQQDMFVEINPSDAADRGIKDGGWVWVTGAENGSKAKVKALVTERVGKGVAWMLFHFGGCSEAPICAKTIPPIPIRSCSVKAQTQSRLTATTRRRVCRSRRLLSVRSERHRRRKHGSDEISLRRRPLH
jgi:anaerobic selenocysteine-containing dehydrogenase